MKVVVALHIYNLRVATGNDESKKREFGLVTAEPVGVDVGFEVVGRVEGNVVQDGGSASGEGADEKRADEAWSVSDSDGVEVGPV